MFADKVNLGDLYSKFKFYLLCNLKELLLKSSEHILYKFNENIFRWRTVFKKLWESFLKSSALRTNLSPTPGRLTTDNTKIGPFHGS